MSTSWSIAGREHTFAASERSAVITDAPNVYAIFADEELAPYFDDYQKGSLSDATIAMRITEEIARLMMVRPRILGRDEDMPVEQNADDPDVVPYAAMQSGEIDELLELWEKSLDGAARFRGESDGPRGRATGKGVGAKPRRKGGAASRKPSGAKA